MFWSGGSRVARELGWEGRGGEVLRMRRSGAQTGGGSVPPVQGSDQGVPGSEQGSHTHMGSPVESKGRGRTKTSRGEGRVKPREGVHGGRMGGKWTKYGRLPRTERSGNGEGAGDRGGTGSN